MGVSNGARVVANIGVQTPAQVKLKVSMIAGPLWGVKLMDVADRWGVARLIYDRAFIEELKFGSDTARALVEGMQKSPWGRYDFHVTMDDFLIVPWTSGIPRLDRGETKKVYSGVGHDGIVDYAMITQIKHCANWMRANA